MIYGISSEHNTARLAGTLAYLETGANAATIEMYDGAPPAPGGAITTQTLLSSIACRRPCGSIVGAKLVLDPPADALITATGNATWARLRNAGGDWAADCDVSDLDGNGALRMATVTLYAGGVARLLTAEFT